MTYRDAFVDYYSILQVNPDCSARELETAYHLLAKTYHPDHGDSADVSKLTEVIAAYKALRNPEDRIRYNQHFAMSTGFVFSADNEGVSEELSALSDADAHAEILMFLYKRRREHAQDAGVGQFFVQEMLNCSDSVFEFHIWYLKAKGLIVTTEQGTLAITIEGVDHVISMSRTAIREKLMIAQSGDMAGQTPS